jgi:hypothetical protein
LYGPDALVEVEVEVEGEDDFIDKLRYYLEHDQERQRLARNSYELGHLEFNECLVSGYMLETALELPCSHAYRWPTASYSGLA